MTVAMVATKFQEQQNNAVTMKSNMRQQRLLRLSQKNKFCIGKAVSDTIPPSDLTPNPPPPKLPRDTFSPRLSLVQSPRLSVSPRHDHQPDLPCAANTRLYVFPLRRSPPMCSDRPLGLSCNCDYESRANGLTHLYICSCQLERCQIPSSEVISGVAACGQYPSRQTPEPSRIPTAV